MLYKILYKLAHAYFFFFSEFQIKFYAYFLNDHFKPFSLYSQIFYYFDFVQFPESTILPSILILCPLGFK